MTEAWKRFVQCMEKVLWLSKHVESDLRSFVLEVSQSSTMLHGRVDQPKFIAIKLKHIGNNQHYTTWEMADILKISKSIKSLMKMKNVSFILWKNYGLFGQPNNNSCNILRYIISRYCANDNDFIYVATFTVVLRYYDARL